MVENLFFFSGDLFPFFVVSLTHPTTLHILSVNFNDSSNRRSLKDRLHFIQSDILLDIFAGRFLTPARLKKRHLYENSNEEDQNKNEIYFLVHSERSGMKEEALPEKHC